MENVYEVDETGVLLGVLESMKVLVGREDLRVNKELASSMQ